MMTQIHQQLDGVRGGANATAGLWDRATSAEAHGHLAVVADGGRADAESRRHQRSWAGARDRVVEATGGQPRCLRRLARWVVEATGDEPRCLRRLARWVVEATGWCISVFGPSNTLFFWGWNLMLFAFAETCFCLLSIDCEKYLYDCPIRLSRRAVIVIAL